MSLELKASHDTNSLVEVILLNLYLKAQPPAGIYASRERQCCAKNLRVLSAVCRAA